MLRMNSRWFQPTSSGKNLLLLILRSRFSYMLPRYKLTNIHMYLHIYIFFQKLWHPLGISTLPFSLSLLSPTTPAADSEVTPALSLCESLLTVSGRFHTDIRIREHRGLLCVHFWLGSTLHTECIALHLSLLASSQGYKNAVDNNGWWFL
jgi:hypothetical protein